MNKAKENRSMRTRNTLTATLFIAAMVFLTTGCGKDNGSSSSSGGGTAVTTGSATGEVRIDLSNTTGSTVEGTVTVMVEGQELELPVNVSTLPDSNRTLIIAYEFPQVTAGRQQVVYVTNMTVGTDTILAAGYTLASITAGQQTAVPGSTFQDVEISGSFTASGPVAISGVTTYDYDASTPFMELEGDLSQMDFNVLFVFVNNNCFITTVDPGSDGTCSFRQSITLEPGANAVYVMALNSTGAVTASTPQSYSYNAPAGANGIMLATLIWDTPTSDMDLHCFYFASPAADLSQASDEHCYFSDESISISPIENLDVDDTEGEGPEHITFTTYPDGYYVFAVNSYDLDEDDHATCIVSLNVGTSIDRSVSHTFVTDNGKTYSEPTGWKRCFDVRVSGGVSQVLSPDPSFVYQAASSAKPALPKTAGK